MAKVTFDSATPQQTVGITALGFNDEIVCPKIRRMCAKSRHQLMTSDFLILDIP